jgi:dynein light chain LC8-type
MSTTTGAGGNGKMVCDMDDHGIHGEMKNDALNVAAVAIESNQEEKDISKHIKTFFDQKYGPTWHVIVGSDFRAFVTHESKHFIFFYIGKTAICLFKA